MAGSRLWVGAAGASLVHEEIRERWQNRTHQRFLDNWLDDWKAKDREGTSANGRWKSHLWQGIQFAPLYALEEEATALVLAGARHFEDQVLEPDDLPEPAGLVLCEYPLPILDLHEREYLITGWMWTPGKDLEGRFGTVFCHFTGNHDVPDLLRGEMPPLSILHIGFLPFGASPSQAEFTTGRDDITEVPKAVEASQRFLLIYMQSFWSFVQQRVLVVAPTPHPRFVRKRAEKSQVHLPVLNVVQLRRAEHRSEVEASEDPRHIDWKMRWIVNGHWRWWWFEKEARRRQIWINPYVKGPEDKPLVQRKRVYDVSR